MSGAENIAAGLRRLADESCIGTDHRLLLAAAAEIERLRAIEATIATTHEPYTENRGKL